jgi:hypothetical protein
MNEETNVKFDLKLDATMTHTRTVTALRDYMVLEHTPQTLRAALVDLLNMEYGNGASLQWCMLVLKICGMLARNPVKFNVWASTFGIAPLRMEEKK